MKLGDLHTTVRVHTEIRSRLSAWRSLWLVLVVLNLCIFVEHLVFKDSDLSLTVSELSLALAVYNFARCDR